MRTVDHVRDQPLGLVPLVFEPMGVVACGVDVVGADHDGALGHVLVVGVGLQVRVRREVRVNLGMRRRPIPSCCPSFCARGWTPLPPLSACAPRARRVSLLAAAPPITFFFCRT